MKEVDAAYALVVLLWIPHLAGFLQSWRERKNPISLAILLTIFLVVYTHVFAIIGAHYDLSQGSRALVYCACSGATATYFYVAKAWAKRRFPDSRGKGGQQ